MYPFYTFLHAYHKEQTSKLLIDICRCVISNIVAGNWLLYTVTTVNMAGYSKFEHD